MLQDHFQNYSLGLLDFIPSFMGVRENNVKGNYKFLENAVFKGSSSRGNGGSTLVIRKNNLCYWLYWVRFCFIKTRN